MAHTLTLVNKSVDTFDVWVNRTNEMANTFTLETLTANNNANGAFVTGNSYLFGILGADTLTAFTALRGGNVQTACTLLITSNVYINAASLTFSLGNSTVNTIANNTTFIAANGLATASLAYNLLSVGANVKANSTALFVGNATINAIANSTTCLISNSTSIATQNCGGFFIGTSVVNSTYLACGANVYANVTTFFLGNSSVNVVSNSSTILLGGNVLANQTTITIGTGATNLVSNSSALSLAGGFVLANQTVLAVGNTLSNVIINSTSVSIAGATLITSALRDSVAWENVSIGTRGRTNFVAGNNIFLNVTDNGGQNQVNVQINAVATSGAAIIGGTDTAVEFNDGMNFGGDLTKFSFNKVTSIMTVSNTIVSNVFQLSQSIVMVANQAAFVTSTGPDTVDAIRISSYRSVAYVYSIKNDTANGYQAGQLMLLNDDTTGDLEDFATAYSNALLGTFNAVQAPNTTHILLQFTPVSSLSYTCKLQATRIPI